MFGEDTKVPCPFSTPFPMHLLYQAILELHPFAVNWGSHKQNVFLQFHESLEPPVIQKQGDRQLDFVAGI